MPANEVKEQIVAELKRRFPEPWFERWQVRQNYGESWMAEMFVTGTDKLNGRTVVETSSNLGSLLNAIRALPPHAPAAPGSGEQRVIHELITCDHCGLIHLDEGLGDLTSCKCGRFKPRMDECRVRDVLKLSATIATLAEYAAHLAKGKP